MTDRSVVLRITAHAVLALLFAVAAAAFAQEAVEAWNAGLNVRLWLHVLAALGAVSLSATSLRRARGIASGPPLRQNGALNSRDDG